MISAGRIRVNGRVAFLGESADPEQDEITLDGVPVSARQKPVYIMLHKPRGYVTTMSDGHGRPEAVRLVENCGVRVYPVGRLDMDSEGLLLFTNDGAFANAIMHPRHRVDKIYRVLVSNYSAQGLERLKRPITLDGYTVRAPEARLIRFHEQTGRAELEVTIHEGRKRQVRRMCGAAGMPVQRLLRIAEGSLQLGNLSPGKWRYLTEDELAGLK